MMTITSLAVLAAALTGQTPPVPEAPVRDALDVYCYETAQLNAWTGVLSERGGEAGGPDHFMLDRASGAFVEGKTGSKAFSTGSGRYALQPPDPWYPDRITGAIPGRTIFYGLDQNRAGMAIVVEAPAFVTVYACQAIEPPRSSAYGYEGWGLPVIPE
ncbi:hypothetical protein F1654_11235 [Alkalicaulis satelles]|uniref:Uncharacterized protein n=1 Tax=Alkalicaulis satelles TaxID=2609175 RepID=A0A5M6ZGW5_9PROT|nr:hypothetical protein [Alkalicaulis satelles]KAA5802388.1 hypothetical protein F1654_11235 [Alkalicaulis satelles]